MGGILGNGIGPTLILEPGGGTYPAAARARSRMASISASVFVDLGIGMSILTGTGGGFAFDRIGSGFSLPESGADVGNPGRAVNGALFCVDGIAEEEEGATLCKRCGLAWYFVGKGFIFGGGRIASLGVGSLGGCLIPGFCCNGAISLLAGFLALVAAALPGFVEEGVPKEFKSIPSVAALAAFTAAVMAS